LDRNFSFDNENAEGIKEEGGMYLTKAPNKSQQNQ